VASREFAEHYRAHVAPRLRQACRWQGVRVASGDTTFGAAFAAVALQAVRRGALHLPPHLWNQLQDQLREWLAEATEAALPAADEAETGATKAAIDMARYFRAWEAARQ
jgi:hypothetical protein